MVDFHLLTVRGAGVVLALVCGLPPSTSAQDPHTPVALGWEEANPIPRRFPRVTDANGCRWGLEQDGALVLSGSAAHPTLSLFKHAARFTVNGQAFATEQAATISDGARVRLTGKAGAVPVVRDIWIDRERGAVRYSDTFSNPADEPAQLTITYQNVFDQPVPMRHRGDGVAIDTAATETRDPTLAFIQNQPEGMSSAVFIVNDPKSKLLPVWTGANNSNVCAWDWKLDVPARGAQTVATWIVQRPSLAPGEIKDVTAGFFRNGRLVRPRLDEAAIASLVNFPARGLSAGDENAGESDPASMLDALTRLADRLGIERGETDIYYMNPKSLLEGETTGGPLALESRFGSVTVRLEDVAAVQGGGGRGRWPRVFLRDGHVLSGSVDLSNWKISGAKGWAINLNADTLEALVLRAGPTDGTTIEPPNFFAQLTSGDTLPVRLDLEESLSFITPWGPLEVPAGDITGLWRVRQPTPAARLTLRDGTRLSVLPSPRELKASSSRLGPLALQVTDVAALWPPGVEAPDPDATEEEIASLEELDDHPLPRALLRGSAVLVSTLAESSLTLFGGGIETQLNTADLSTLERAEGRTDASPVFTVTLTSGASFEGTLGNGSIALKTRGDTVWSVPLSHFLGWKQGAAPKTP